MKLIDAQIRLSKLEMKYPKRLQKATKKGISDLVWTGTPTEFIELSKALFLSKCFNKGGVTYKEMFARLCSTFNIQIHNPHSAYTKMKERAEDRTLFLSKLKTVIETDMDYKDYK